MRVQTRAVSEDAVKALIANGLSPVLARLYAARGLQDPAQLQLGLDRLLPPSGLKGIAEAAALLAKAIGAQQKIVIAADYDADGATACVVALEGLRALGAQHLGYVVPDRVKMGYGLSPGLVQLAIAEGAEVLVTVDNGIASIEGVAAAKAAGLTVIITDHHLPGLQLPAADAIVNPNQPGCTFASKAMAGVGVMFYVLLALRAHLRDAGAFASGAAPRLIGLLDLVAVGTVADVARLDYNNRILVEHGLRQIRACQARPGIAALLQVAGRRADSIRSTDLGFVLGPRINAAGRLDDMRIGIRCLLAQSADEALAAASALDRLNRERRTLQKVMSEEALMLTEGSGAYGVTAFDAQWHEGIVGLIASKLKEAHHRPSIAFAPSDDPALLKGSARSVEGFHIRDAIAAVDAQHPGLIARFGGHAMAAGLTISAAQYPAFAAAFDAACVATLTPKQLERLLETDGELAAHDMTLDTVRQLDAAQPWGQGFEEPVFAGQFMVQSMAPLGKDGAHRKYQLQSPDGRVLTAVQFAATGEPLGAGQVADAAYVLAANEWAGKTTLQLQLRWLASA